MRLTETVEAKGYIPLQKYAIFIPNERGFFFTKM